MPIWLPALLGAFTIAVLVPTSIPRVGDVYTVFYSAADPGNQKTILLFPGRVTAAQAAAARLS